MLNLTDIAVSKAVFALLTDSSVLFLYLQDYRLRLLPPLTFIVCLLVFIITILDSFLRIANQILIK